MKVPLGRRGKFKMSDTSQEELSAKLLKLFSEEIKTVNNNKSQGGGQTMSNIKDNNHQNKEVQVNFIISYNSQSNEPQTNDMDISNEQMKTSDFTNSLNEDMLLLNSNQNN